MLTKSEVQQMQTQRRARAERQVQGPVMSFLAEIAVWVLFGIFLYGALDYFLPF
jgi:hypothetical protein